MGIIAAIIPGTKEHKQTCCNVSVTAESVLVIEKKSSTAAINLQCTKCCRTCNNTKLNVLQKVSWLLNSPHPVWSSMMQIACDSNHSGQSAFSIYHWQWSKNKLCVLYTSWLPGQFAMKSKTCPDKPVPLVKGSNNPWQWATCTCAVVHHSLPSELLVFTRKAFSCSCLQKLLEVVFVPRIGQIWLHHMWLQRRSPVWALSGTTSKQTNKNLAVMWLVASALCYWVFVPVDTCSTFGMYLCVDLCTSQNCSENLDTPTRISCKLCGTGMETKRHQDFSVTVIFPHLVS